MPESYDFLLDASSKIAILKSLDPELTSVSHDKLIDQYRSLIHGIISLASDLQKYIDFCISSFDAPQV